METPAEVQAPQTAYQTKLALPSFSDLLSRAWQQYREQHTVIIGIVLVPAILSLAQIFLAEEPTVPASAYFIFSCIATLIGLVAQFAIVGVSVNGAPSVSSAYNTAIQHFGSFFWISMLCGLVVIGGMLLLFIPGIIFGMVLMFSLLMLPAEGRHGFSALVQSWFYVKGYWWSTFGKLFSLGLIFVIVLMGGFLLLAPTMGVFQGNVPGDTDMGSSIPSSIFVILLQSFIMLPLQTLFLVQLYHSLKEIKAVQPGTFNPGKALLTLKIFAGIGAVLAILFFSYMGHLFSTNSAEFMEEMRSGM